MSMMNASTAVSTAVAISTPAAVVVTAGDAAPPLLQVSGLKTHFFTRAGVIKAVDGVNFHLGQGGNTWPGG